MVRRPPTAVRPFPRRLAIVAFVLVSAGAVALAGGEAELAAAHYRAALEAEARGASDDARREFERVLELDPEHLAARRALGYERVGDRWLRGDEARIARGLVLYDGQWRLPSEIEALARAEPVPKISDARGEGVETLLTRLVDGEPEDERAAQRALAAMEPRPRLRGALAALDARRPAVRAAAAQLLAELGDEVALRPLLVAAVRDADADVRGAAIDAVVSLGHPDAAVPLVKALGSATPRIVANAAHALGELGDRRALVYVVKRMSGGGDSPRVFAAFVNQISYVRDFDVEVAQAANIADPDVGVIQEGAVIDVDVATAMTRTWLEPILVDAAGRLAGKPFRSADEARAWVIENESTLPRFESSVGRRAPRRPARAKVLGAPVLD